MARWYKDELTTAQTFAHEIAHTLGVFHDWEIPNERIKNGRTNTCGPNRFKGGPNNQIMNYGNPRHSTWSDCSNADFSNYYYRTYINTGFCLRGKFDLNNTKVCRVCSTPFGINRKGFVNSNS